MSAEAQVESEILEEYSRLDRNISELADITTSLSGMQPEILERLRPLETRLGLVLTLFKASVWQYLSQEQAREEEELQQSQH